MTVKKLIRRVGLPLAAAMVSASASAVVLTETSPACALSNITGSVACAGSFAGNDSGNASTTQNVQDTLNFYFDSAAAGAKFDLPGDAVFTLVGKSDDGGSGPFTSNPSGSNGTLTFDSAVTGYFVVSLKSSNAFSLYLLDGGASGLTSLSYSTPGTQGLSHATLWTTGIVPGIPEPHTYALMLAGLGAVGFMARRRRQG